MKKGCDKSDTIDIKMNEFCKFSIIKIEFIKYPRKSYEKLDKPI